MSTSPTNLSVAWSRAVPAKQESLAEQIRNAAGQIEQLAADVHTAWRAADVCHRDGNTNSRANCLKQWIDRMEEMNDVQLHMNRLALKLCRAKAQLLEGEADHD